MNRDRIPAIVLCSEAGFDEEIAGLNVLDRLLVTLHRAGCGPLIVVAQGALPSLRRSEALGFPLQKSASVETPATDVLVAGGNLVVQVADVREVIQQRGRLGGADG